MSEYSTEWLTEVIKKLPADKEMSYGTQGYSRYRTQKAHWLGWLTKKPGAKYFRQDAPKRGAKFVYNHIMEPKMLLWLISASGLQIELVEQAKEASLNKKSMASSCAAIRKVVPWQILEMHLNNQ